MRLSELLPRYDRRMSNAVISPGDHENAAISALHDHADMAEAQVLAILALASAVNRLAEAQETLANAVTGLGYSHQGQEFSDHAAELRKHPQVTPGSSHLLGAGHIKRFRRSSVVHGQDRDESRLTCGSGADNEGAGVPGPLWFLPFSFRAWQPTMQPRHIGGTSS